MSDETKPDPWERLRHIVREEAGKSTEEPAAEQPPAWATELAGAVSTLAARAAPAGKPRSDNGAPRPIQDYDSLRDPNQLTRDDIRRMEAQHGKVQAWHKIRKMAEAFYADRPIVTEGR